MCTYTYTFIHISILGLEAQQLDVSYAYCGCVYIKSPHLHVHKYLFEHWNPRLDPSCCVLRRRLRVGALYVVDASLDCYSLVVNPPQDQISRVVLHLGNADFARELFLMSSVLGSSQLQICPNVSSQGLVHGCESNSKDGSFRAWELFRAVAASWRVTARRSQSSAFACLSSTNDLVWAEMHDLRL